MHNENGFYPLNEIFNFENSDEITFVHNCEELLLNVVFSDASVFSVVFINEKLNKKKMLK